MPHTHDLALSCLPLAYKIAHSFRKTYPRWGDEFEGEALLALVKAARSFDPSRAKFTTWTGRLVTQACLEVVKARRRQVPAVSLDSTDEGTGFTFMETLADDAPEVGTEMENRERAEYALRQLPARSQEMIRQRAEGETFAAVGAKHGLSRSRVEQVILASREMLIEA